MEFIGYYYCDVILLKVITTASIKDQTNRVSAVFQARRVKGDISVTGISKESKSRGQFPWELTDTLGFRWSPDWFCASCS